MRKSVYQEEKKPKVPAGMRALNAGEEVQEGDQRWMGGKLTTIIPPYRPVSRLQEGFFFRKV